MEKNFFTKLFIILLFCIILSTILFTSNVQATSTVVAPNIKSDETNLNFFEGTPVTNIENLETEETLSMYDVKTGETTVIPIDSSPEISSIEGYIPFAFKRFSQLRNTNSNYSLISDTSGSYYTPICRIKWYVSSTEEGCGTGILVGKNLLLTNAHCVFNMNRNDTPHSNWAVYPGYMNHSSFKNLSAGWSRVYYPTNWFVSHAAEDDWCICELGDSIGSVAGYFGLDVYSSSGLLKTTVNCYGYPVSVPVDGVETNTQGELMFYTTGRILSVADGWFDGNFTVSEGMSGGPIIEPSRPSRVVGLNRGFTSTAGIGTRITSTILNKVNELRGNS